MSAVWGSTDMGGFDHTSVLLQETLAFLNPQPGEVFLDGTLGGAGHASVVAGRIGEQGLLIGLDRDPAALAAAAKRLESVAGRVSLHRSAFADMAQVVESLEIDGLDGVLLDLGVSSHQIDTPERGFSFRFSGPLDMRMNPDDPVSAADLVNNESSEELVRIFREYGEERWARRIARRIEEERARKPIETTERLVDIVRSAVPAAKADKHPATRVFQALRIAVNGELNQVKQGLAAALDLLRPGGRLVVISFHSLEDRIVKQFMRDQAQTCICPPRLPVCSCKHQPKLRVLTGRGVRATEQEIEGNPRSRSAVLRAAVRL